MISLIEQALEDARREKAEGRPHDAEVAYSRAMELARSDGDELALAHALRHVSDLERLRGAPTDAFAHATEAVAIYRGSSDRLGLANAIRLQALSASDSLEAQQLWQEARDLYRDLGVTAGVAECDSRISG